MRRDGTVIITSSSRLFSPLRAEVAELADAQASGACGRKVVEVQILSSAPILNRRGPLHPAWLTPFRSHFAARSTPFAYEIGGDTCIRLAHSVPLALRCSLHSVRL